MNRKGEFFFTSTGVQFWPLDPRPDEISIEDIAHGLAHVCRWGGHCQRHFPVAQHSVLVADNCPPGLRLQGLLHDATEAYLGDMIRPIKRCMEAYQEAEYHLWSVIAEKFGLPNTLDPKVKDADNRALITERRDLMHPSVTRVPWPYVDELEPFPQTIKPLSPLEAKELFLNRFAELTA